MQTARLKSGSPTEGIVLQAGVRRSLAALIAAGIIACDGPFDPEACVRPSVLQSSVSVIEKNVLAAALTAKVTSADSVFARFSAVGQSNDDVTPAFDARSDTVTVPVLGLREETQYRVTVVARNSCGSRTGDMLHLTTGALPSDLPRYSASGDDAAPGYVAFAAGSYGVVIDNTGRVVWYHRFSSGPGLNFQPQGNGRYVARPSPEPGAIAQWVEIDPLGRQTRTLGCAGGLNARFHDMIARADSTYWVMCDETRAIHLEAFGLSSASLVMGTSVQRRSHDGSVLFQWSPFDHLAVDPTALEPIDLAGSVINWTHGNAIDLDADGNLLVSFRNLSEITNIDTATGAVRWRLGGARSEFTFDNGTAPPFARQHGVRSTGTGQLQLLDNLGELGASRAERYAYDEIAKTARLTRAYAPVANIVALTGGTTQPLHDGRTLVSFGSGGLVEEVDKTGRVVWRIDGNPGYVFRAHRIQSLYTPGKGDTR